MSPVKKMLAMLPVVMLSLVVKSWALLEKYSTAPASVGVPLIQLAVVLHRWSPAAPVQTCVAGARRSSSRSSRGRLRNGVRRGDRSLPLRPLAVTNDATRSSQLRRGEIVMAKLSFRVRAGSGRAPEAAQANRPGACPCEGLGGATHGA